MTTLIYKDNILIGDSFQINTFTEFSNDIIVPVHKSKIYLSENKTFGYGICGCLIDERDKKEFEEWLVNTIQKYLKHEEITALPRNNFQLIFMGSDELLTFILQNRENKINIRMIGKDEYQVFGSGIMYAVSELVDGGTAFDAIEKAKLYDPLTACDVYAIKRSDLKKLTKNKRK